MINAFSASLQQPMPGIGTPGMHSSATLHSGKPFSPTGLVCSAGCTTPPVAGAVRIVAGTDFAFVVAFGFAVVVHTEVPRLVVSLPHQQ